MTDIMSILATGYTSASLTSPTKKPYKDVDPKLYQGSWTGTYSNSKKFSFLVSNVQGFRAQVKYQSGTTVSYQSVLINDSSFRVGDTKFTLNSNGTASIRTAITNPATGNASLITGTASR